jgi:hypothetical protein
MVRVQILGPDSDSRSQVQNLGADPVCRSRVQILCTDPKSRYQVQNLGADPEYR